MGKKEKEQAHCFKYYSSWKGDKDIQSHKRESMGDFSDMVSMSNMETSICIIINSILFFFFPINKNSIECFQI